MARRFNGFEQEFVEPADPAAPRLYLGVDGTGVPVPQERGRGGQGQAGGRQREDPRSQGSEHPHGQACSPELQARLENTTKPCSHWTSAMWRYGTSSFLFRKRSEGFDGALGATGNGPARNTFQLPPALFGETGVLCRSGFHPSGRLYHGTWRGGDEGPMHGVLVRGKGCTIPTDHDRRTCSLKMSTTDPGPSATTFSRPLVDIAAQLIGPNLKGVTATANLQASREHETCPLASGQRRRRVGTLQRHYQPDGPG